MLGSGTLSDPYIITTPAELFSLTSGTPSGTYYKIGNDIDMSGYAWGTNYINISAGCELNGNGKTVKNLTAGSSVDVGAFIRNCSGVVKNLKLESVTLNSGDAHCGGFVHIALTGSSIVNCQVSGKITQTSSYVGGFASLVQQGAAISKCRATVQISGGASTVGGFAAYNAGLIEECEADGTSLATTNTGTSYVGGFLGAQYTTDAAVTRNCGTHVGSLSGTGTTFQAGFCANFATGTFSYCTSTTAVTSAANNAGFFGTVVAGKTVISCYYDSDKASTKRVVTATTEYDANITRLTTAQMAQQANFSGLDFTTRKWKMGQNYPLVASINILMYLLIQDGTDIKKLVYTALSQTPRASFNARLADGTNPGSASLATFKDLSSANTATLSNFSFNASSGWGGDGSAGNPFHLIFDGTNDVVSVPVASNTNFCVSVWINFVSLPASGQFPTFIATGKVYASIINTGVIYCLWSDATKSQSTVSLTTGVWNHIVIDMIAKKIYVNKVDVTTALSMTWSTSALTGLVFGTSFYPTPVMKLARAGIFDTSLSAGDIDTEYQRGPSGNSATSLTKIGVAPVTQIMFENNGLSDFSVLPSLDVSALSGDSLEFLISTDDTVSPALRVSGIPKPQVIIQNHSTTLLGALKSIVASATESGAGKVRFALSGDGGVTWKSLVWGTTNGTTSIIPAMTSNNTPTPVVISASDFFNSSTSPYMAFDGSSGTYWESSSSHPVGGSWLKVDLGSARGASGISLTPFLVTGSSYSLADWEFYGSNDDTNWNLLASGTHGNSAAKEKYTFSDRTPYRYYRLNAIGSYQGTFSGVAEMEIFGYERTIVSFGDTDFIPKMTANNAPSPFVVSVDSESSGYNSAPFHVFDDSSIVEGDGTVWITVEPFPTGGHWLKIDLGVDERQMFHSFSMAAMRMSASTYSVKSWILYGSNDDSAWTQIASGTHENNALRKTYTITSPGSYRYYRINFPDSWFSTYIGLYEVEFFAINVGAWTTLDISDLTAFGSNGLTASGFSFLDPDKLAQIISTDLRIAIYLEQQTGADKAAVNFIRINSDVPAYSPAINSITINYDAIDEKYYGMLFMDVSQQYYSTSFGEILQYLDFGTLVAGTTSLEVKVTLTNGYNFPVNNIRLFSDEIPPGVTVELSKTTSPFISKSNLSYSQIMQPDDIIDFYVRLTSDLSTKAGGNFNIRVAADPVT